MSQSTLLKLKGLYTFPSHLDAVPSGALLVARNVSIDRDSVGQSRRGYKLYGTEMDASITNTAHQLLNYKGRILRHWGASTGTTLDYDSDGAGVFANFAPASRSGDISSGSPTVTNIQTTSNLSTGMFVSGTGIPANTTISTIPSNTSITLSNNATATATTTLSFTYDVAEASLGVRIKSVEQNGNLYFTTSKGIKKLSASNASGLSAASITLAGGIAALDVQTTLNNATGFLSTQSVVAYRIVWGVKDANNNLILGSPSSRSIIRNTSASATKTVDLRFSIPQGITTSYFYQIYRTEVVADSSGDVDPGDEQGLVYENNPSNTDLTNGYITVTDITPDALRGANLYTNQLTGEGIAQSNDEPPFAQDISSYKGYTFFANTQTKQSLNFSMLSVSALVSNTSSLTITDGTTAGTHTYTFKTLTLNGDTTSGSNTITNLSSTTNLTNGLSLSNANIPSGAVITRIVSATSVEISVNASGNAVGTPIIFAQESKTSRYVALSRLATPSQQVDETARSLVRIINQQTDEIVNAFYLSGPDDVPGMILLKAKSLAQTSFFLNVNDAATTGSQFSPILPGSIAGISMANPTVVTSAAHNLQTGDSIVIVNSNSTPTINGTQTVTVATANTFTINVNVTIAGTSANWYKSGALYLSSNESKPNRIYYSKFQQPEAVPSLNYIDIGPQDKQILRILGLRDSLIVLKEEGLYRLSGAVAPFTVSPFDFSTNLKAVDSAVILNNMIYCFTNQGIATIKDTEVAIISRPIEDQLLPLNTPAYSNFSTATFGISYESDRSYYFFTVSDTSDTHATQCFRFNSFTNTWTIYDITKRSGIVNSGDDRLYLAPTDINYIEQERKSFNRTDLADREHVISLDAQTVSTSMTFPTLSNIEADDVGVQTQYLTINKFNRLLTKLDRDNLLSPRNYVSTLEATPGVNLSSQLDLLIAKIRDDDGRDNTPGFTADASYTALLGLGAASFSALQTNFNSLITLLNADVGVRFKDYTSSTGTQEIEFPLLTTNTATNLVTTDYAYPLIAGPITIYNHIETELQWVPQYMGDTSMTKQVSEGTLIFEDSSFTNATLSYATDLSADFEEQVVTGNGPGTFGNGIFGEGVFGGSGSGVPFRTYIPRNKQYCRYINVRFEHTRAREVFSLYGSSLTARPISQRGWR